jgi:hypothetical protein
VSVSVPIARQDIKGDEIVLRQLTSQALERAIGFSKHSQAAIE